MGGNMIQAPGGIGRGPTHAAETTFDDDPDRPYESFVVTGFVDTEGLVIGGLERELVSIRYNQQNLPIDTYKPERVGQIAIQLRAYINSQN